MRHVDGQALIFLGQNRLKLSHSNASLNRNRKIARGVIDHLIELQRLDRDAGFGWRHSQRQVGPAAQRINSLPLCAGAAHFFPQFRHRFRPEDGDGPEAIYIQ